MYGFTADDYRAAFERVRRGESPGEIVQGDALRVLMALPSGSVDLIFGDLPFNLGKDFVRFGRRPPDLPSDDLPPEAYRALCRAWMTEAVRVLADHGSLYVMTAAEHLRFMLAALDELAGWQDTIVWPNTSMPRRERYTPAWQPILWYSKTEQYVYHHDADGGPTEAALPWGRKPQGHTMTNVWADIKPVNGGCMASREAIFVPGTKKKAHAAQMPLGLPRRAILACTEEGMLVVDLWVGSGTTAVAAAETGRRFFVADVDPRCVALSAARLRGNPGAAIAGYLAGEG
ncbi:MAG: site-specific DNA-methyltransferase [Anaerolineae bacterium]